MPATKLPRNGSTVLSHRSCVKVIYILFLQREYLDSGTSNVYTVYSNLSIVHSAVQSTV